MHRHITHWMAGRPWTRFSVIVYCLALPALGPGCSHASQVPRRSTCPDHGLDLVGRACRGWGGLADLPPLARSTPNPTTGARASVQPTAAAASCEGSVGQKGQGATALLKPQATGLMLIMVQATALSALQHLSARDQSPPRAEADVPEVGPLRQIRRKVGNESTRPRLGKPCVR